VLIDEENGSVVGELSEGFNVIESKDVKAGSKSMPLFTPLKDNTDWYQILSRLNCHKREEVTTST